ncbi:MAG: restriction endonuclease subunit S [Bacteroidaceae bacterium]|nr:restriction endonuclease subunit S [Bacteroidaceae bacterium]
MMEEWKEYKIGDVCNTISDTYKNNAESVVLINTSDVLEGKCLNHEKVPNKDLKGQFKKNFQKNDILYSEIRPANKRFAYIDFDPIDYIASTKLMVIRHNEKILPQYLFYILKSQTIIEELQMLAESRSGTFPQITFSEVANIEIKLPPIEQQRRLLGVLKSLDDKIEVNRKINENLEQQAQALFKSWFVDFEPFKNGEFVESELGMIPKGWRVESLTSFGRIVCGKTPSKSESSYYGGNIPFIKIPDMHNMVFVGLSEDSLSQMGDESQLAKRIPPYSILVSCIATVGLVCINTKESHTNQQINSIIPYSSFFRYYLYQKMLSLKDYLINLGRGGTATLNVNTKIFGSIKIIKPTDELLFDYDKQVSPLFNKIEANQQESRRLAELRDTLLPKLMSGELKVNDLV